MWLAWRYIRPRSGNEPRNRWLRPLLRAYVFPRLLVDLSRESSPRKDESIPEWNFNSPFCSNVNVRCRKILFAKSYPLYTWWPRSERGERVKTTPERTSTGITFDRETVDEPISSSARYRFTASHPQVQHALTSDFRRAYNSSCALFRDSFIIRNGTRDRSFDLLPPLEPFEGCEERDRQSFLRSLFRAFWKRIDSMRLKSFQIILRHVRCFEIANVERIWIHAITYNFLELI